MSRSPMDPGAAHRAYWSTPEVIAPFAADQPSLRWYEHYVVSQVAPRLAARFSQVRRIHVIGCGAGREIPPLRATFSSATIVASDLSAEMVAVCRRNLEGWACTEAVELQSCTASALIDDEGAALATAFDNVLTYVVPETERLAMLSAVAGLLAPGGFVVGIVHHRWGRVPKAAYFAAQALLSPLGLASGELGDRMGGDHGHCVPFHYFTRSELATLLATAGLATIAIRPLAELGRALGQRYFALAGSNNLVFMAEVQRPIHPPPRATG